MHMMYGVLSSLLQLLYMESLIKTKYFHSTNPSLNLKPSSDSRKLFQLKPFKKTQSGHPWIVQKQQQNPNQRCHKSYCQSLSKPKTRYEYILQKNFHPTQQHRQLKQPQQTTVEPVEVKIQRLPAIESMAPKVSQYLHLLLAQNSRSPRVPPTKKQKNSPRGLSSHEGPVPYKGLAGQQKYNSFTKRMKMVYERKNLNWNIDSID